MRNWGLSHFKGMFLFLLTILLMLELSAASYTNIGKIHPPFQGSQMTFIDKNGLFLLSNSSNFGFGFKATEDVTMFLLSIIHIDSKTVVWSGNRASLVRNSDNFVFDDSGNVFLKSGNSVVWSTGTANKGVSTMELLDSGNLVLRGNDGRVVWGSFSHPTDTLLPNQAFTQGMKLVSDPTPNNLSYFMEINSGDMILYAGFQNPQPYWSIRKDNRLITNKNGGVVTSASLKANSWRFYDKDNVFLSQFIFSEDNIDENATWVAVLGNDGFITFSRLQSGGSSQSPKQIPNDPCGIPEPCDPYFVCSTGHMCQCPSGLSSRNCKTGITSPCGRSDGPMELVDAGANLNYFALGFISPFSKTDLNGCKASCFANCSCLAMFFDNSLGNCFHFDRIGSFQSSASDNSFTTFVRVSSRGGSGSKPEDSGNRFPYVIIIAVATVFVIIGLIFAGYMYYRRKRDLPDDIRDSSEEDNFLESLSGMPIRFTYRDLERATNEFSVKLGQGGFGSVYLGTLPDGTRVAVKKLEGIGQGKKEFRAEVSIIGSIHHLHLVRLKGFCAEGTHRLLAYEYMAKGSLDKWIFKRAEEEEFCLDWDTRFNIALGTAKGLAYLHEDCDSKIIHCDIKPENVLLDDNFFAKVSDFGLAKLMTREQSHVFTTLRGTRGYLAPEWITNYAISEKSDVYSYGMVLLEIIGGRKNYDPSETSARSHFPTYASKMMEEGELRSILDWKLHFEGEDERVGIAIKVALWCIQEDMHLRPPMTRVVQMLEGLCPVATPPMASQMGSRLYPGFFKSVSEEGTSSGPSDCNSDAYLSAVRLSGPR